MRRRCRNRRAAISGEAALQGNGFLAIWSDVPSERETDYLHWLTREHTSERLGVEGFVAVRVYRAIRQDVCRYFIHYQLTSPSVLSSHGYLERLNAPTPWSQRIMTIVGNFVRGGGRVVAEAGVGRGCVLAALKLDAQSAGIGRKLESIAALDRIVAARLLETDLEKTTIATREKSMRRQDASFPGLLLIEGLDAGSVEAAISVSGLEPAEELYLQIFQL